MTDLFALDWRFWSKVIIGAPDECWEWQAARFGTTGYGLFEVDNVSRGAHRIAALLAFGPSDEFVLHSCDNPPCANPRHLRYGTQKDNMADRRKRGGYASELCRGPRTKPAVEAVLTSTLRERLQEHPVVTAADEPGVVGSGTYDWRFLLDGRTWELVHGQDFICSLRSFRTQAYRHATRQGKRAQVSVRGDRLYLRACDGPTTFSEGAAGGRIAHGSRFNDRIPPVEHRGALLDDLPPVEGALPADTPTDLPAPAHLADPAPNPSNGAGLSEPNRKEAA